MIEVSLLKMQYTYSLCGRANVHCGSSGTVEELHLLQDDNKKKKRTASLLGDVAVLFAVDFLLGVGVYSICVVHVAVRLLSTSSA